MPVDKPAAMQQALAQLQAGGMVVLVDDVCRENEADLCCAAQSATAENIAFMANNGRGLICLALTAEQGERLDLQPMATRNTSPLRTAFTCSIEARHGVTTGISAHDRARTIEVAIAKDAKPTDIVQPGHMFPLIAKSAGVLERFGHTEASVDLARLAGCQPAAVICEIMAQDGSMVAGQAAMAFAEQHALPVLAISTLLQYRLQSEPWLIYDGSMVLPPQQLARKAVLHAFRQRHRPDEELLLVHLPQPESNTIACLQVYQVPPLLAAAALANPAQHLGLPTCTTSASPRSPVVQVWLPQSRGSSRALRDWFAHAKPMPVALPIAGTCQAVYWAEMVAQSLRCIGIGHVQWSGPAPLRAALTAAGLKVSGEQRYNTQLQSAIVGSGYVQ